MNYNQDFITTLSTIKPITNSFGIIKEEENEKLKIKFKGETVGFILSAPESYLQFPGDFLGFLDLDRFLKYYNIFNIENKDEELADKPQLSFNVNQEQQVNEIVIGSSKGKQKFTYRTGNKQSIAEQKFNGAKLPTIDTVLKLSKAQNDHLHKIISIVKPNIINFAFSNNTCKITFNNIVTDDKYDIEYNTEIPVENEFNYNIMAESINVIPSGEYTLNICSRGYIQFHQERTDGIELDLYVCKKVER